MDTTDIVEMTEVSRLIDANKLVAKGWTLLGLAPGSSADGNDRIPYFLYSLGRTAGVPE